MKILKLTQMMVSLTSKSSQILICPYALTNESLNMFSHKFEEPTISSSEVILNKI